MVQEQRLAGVLTEFARTLVTDFPIQGILDHLVGRIVEVLPVTAAGVTLISPGTAPQYIAASNADALRFEKLQTTTGQVPCISAYESGQAVSVPDLLRGDDRFPTFCADAASAGLAAVFTFPLRHEVAQLGALDLYRDTTGSMDQQDMAAAQVLADVASAYLLNAQGRQDLLEAADVLRASTRHNALHDVLTGLPNRVLLRERLQQAASRAQRSHTDAAVLFADLDGFKEVNETYGHTMGDALLVAVALRLSTLLRAGDTLARVSGDEFVVLCEDIQAVADVEGLALRIHDAFDAPFTVADANSAPVEIPITASVGMAYAGRAEDITDQLVHDADIAMHQAKSKGGAAHQVIDLREAGRSADRLKLRRDLRAALRDDQLDLAYQPIVRAWDGLVTGMEALLRWTDSDGDPIPASMMVGVAEESTLIVDIGSWVLQRSCRDRVRWLRQHPDRPLDLAVNVSARQLMSPRFSDVVARVLESTGMSPAALTLEMTEDILLDDGARAMAVLGDLQRLGVRLALDDFGTGYSSLSYLRRFPVDIVKIDREFVADIGGGAGGAIVAAVVNLAHVLGLSVTAEGVETPRQRDEVVALGCESAQGHYYLRPLPGGELVAWLQAQPSARVCLPEDRPW